MAEAAAPASQEHTAETGHEAGFPQFDTTTYPSQLLWLAIVFALLYYMMSRVALPRVDSIFSIRKARISGDLDEASRLQKDAETAHETYEKTLSAARTRAQGVAHEMRDKLHTESETKRHALEESLNAKLAASEAAIGETRRGAMANVDTIARDAAAAILEKLTGRPGNAEAIDHALSTLKA